MGNAILLMNNGGLLDHIAVTTPPNKTKYSTRSGSTFDTAGMVVTAYYMNGTSKAVSGYTCNNPSYWSTTGTKIVTITYVETGITKTATTSVTVIAATKSYSISEETGWIAAHSTMDTVFTSIDDADYQSVSAIKVKWRITQSGSDGAVLVYNDTDNYQLRLLRNDTSHTYLVGNSPFSSWGDTYVHGTYQEETYTNTVNTTFTSAALRFTNNTSSKFYCTISGTLTLTTAY